MSEPRRIEYKLLEKLIKEEKYEEAVLEGLKKAGIFKENKITNYERIKSMSLDEMAEFLIGLSVNHGMTLYTTKDMGSSFYRKETAFEVNKKWLEKEYKKGIIPSP